MITHLNYNSNSWVRIFEIDLTHPLPDQSPKEYFVTQLDICVEQQYKLGYYLRTLTDYGKSWILVFTPEKSSCNYGGRLQ